MNINQLQWFLHRNRKPLVPADPPKPLAAGDVCPHCGRVVAAETNAEAPKPETVNEPVVVDAQPVAMSEPLVLEDGHQVEPVEISKPKKSRADANKN